MKNGIKKDKAYWIIKMKKMGLKGYMKLYNVVCGVI
jgi:hypothetical protein